MIYTTDIEKIELIIEHTEELLKMYKADLKHKKEKLLRDSYPADPILRDILS
tara:strand:+ start:356 stop:511 length:156 start_codon:yes stop_codon:yes gene_type:complete